MKHFLTICRDLEYKNVREERLYYFNKRKKQVDEVFEYYDLESGNYLMGDPKRKTRNARDFMINLEVMADHPGVTFKDSDFIMWYARQVAEKKL